MATAGTSALILTPKSLRVEWAWWVGLGWDSQVAENPEKTSKFTLRVRVAPNLKLPGRQLVFVLRSDFSLCIHAQSLFIVVRW